MKQPVPHLCREGIVEHLLLHRKQRGEYRLKKLVYGRAIVETSGVRRAACRCMCQTILATVFPAWEERRQRTGAPKRRGGGWRNRGCGVLRMPRRRRRRSMKSIQNGKKSPSCTGIGESAPLSRATAILTAHTTGWYGCVARKIRCFHKRQTRGMCHGGCRGGVGGRPALHPTRGVA